MGAQTDERRIGVYKNAVHLPAVAWCGKRLVPVPSLQIPRHVEVYSIDNRARDQVRCSPSEEQRWAAAAHTYWEWASRVEDELYRAHWGWRAKLVRPRTLIGARWWMQPFPWPGWQRRLAERSEKAQRAFVAALERAAEEYRPVREEIEARLEERELQLKEESARRRAAEEAARRAAERRRSVLYQLAARRVWVCVDPADKDAVFVYRADVPPDQVPDAGQRHSEPLTVSELEDVLREAREAGRSRVEWDPRACAAVEDDCREQEVRVAFAEWWVSVTGYRWRTRTTATGPCIVHVSAHTSVGVGLGGTAVSDGGGSGGYSGGHSFGTCF